MHGAARPALRGQLLMLALLTVAAVPLEAAAATYYVRQTVGDDGNDGLSPKTAWQHVWKLSDAMHAGDMAYVGPGLYREEIEVRNDGTAENRLVFIADTTGQHTGDPPGVVMLTGADAVDEDIFLPYSSPGVYMAQFPAFSVWGVVEMDGAQYRYLRVNQTNDYLVDKAPGPSIVAKYPSSYFYDEGAKVLYIHTSNGAPPKTHEIELIHRGSGINATPRHYVTVIGFTFRHFQDAGIEFFKQSSDGIAINNISYGSRQGIRVYTASNMLIYGNTLFRNENCGVYFAVGSVNGQAISNVMYDNIKGVRWGSHSVNGLALDNIAFENHDRGISIEDTNHVTLRDNTLVGNVKSQLLVDQGGDYDSQGNCFENRGPDQLIADFRPYPPTEAYKTLAAYQQGRHEDLGSREGGCRALPEKLDVHKLHAETSAYTERARKILSGSAQAADNGSANTQPGAGQTLRQWLAKLLGR